MTEQYKPTYLVSNINQKERLEEIEPQLKRNLEEINEEKTGSRSLEAKYREFLYFMARYEASIMDRKAVKDMVLRIKDYDMLEMNKDILSRREEAKTEEASEVRGEAIAARYRKLIDYKDLTIPNNLALAGNLGLKDGGVPLRAKYFGTGVSSTYIKTWDQLLYALETAEPRIAELDEHGQPTELTGKEVVTTAPFWDRYGVRTDKAVGLKTIMENYKPTI